MRLALLWTCGAIACGASSTPPPATPTAPASPEPAPPPAAVAQAPAPPPASSTPPPQATPNAVPIPPAAAAGAAPVLLEMAKGEAPNAKPEGDVLAGEFLAGQLLERELSLLPGKCYTVIASSMGGIKELDIQLVATARNQPPVLLAQDLTTGPGAIIGGKATGCWKNPLPVAGSAKLILRATSGGGVAAAQIFVR